MASDYIDLTNVAVVRDRDGVTWGVVGPGRWLSLDGSDVRIGAVGLGLHHGPLTPILDLDGQPIVRTVGDLTARHIGRRVRVGDGAGAIEGRLLNIEHDKRTTDVAIAEGDQDVADWWPADPRDTPCEVLP